MIPSSQIDYYGDTTRWFIGTVIDINDPLQMGRVRVRIYGIHSSDTGDIPLGALPWAQIVTPITEGGSSGIGANTGIKPMAQVYGIFLDGKNSQLPLVMGSIPKFEPVHINQVESDITDDELPSRPDGSPATRNVIPTNIIDTEKLVGSNNKEKCYNFFISDEVPERFLPHQAAGIVGNFVAESGDTLDPNTLNKAEGSFGIAQWNPATAAGNRKQRLEDFARRNNMPINSLYLQLHFTIHELYTYGYLGLAQLQAAEDVETATKVFEQKFERPAKGSTNKRVRAARELLAKMETVSV